MTNKIHDQRANGSGRGPKKRKTRGRLPTFLEYMDVPPRWGCTLLSRGLPYLPRDVYITILIEYALLTYYVVGVFKFIKKKGTAVYWGGPR